MATYPYAERTRENDDQVFELGEFIDSHLPKDANGTVSGWKTPSEDGTEMIDMAKVIERYIGMVNVHNYEMRRILRQCDGRIRSLTTALALHKF